jgi:hypothetical protein
MSLRHCVSLLGLASLLLLQLAAAEFDPAVCSENCRFVVVPSLGPAGPPGLDGLNGRDGLNGTDGANGLNGADGRDGLNGTNGRDGAAGTIDTSVIHAGLKLDSPVVTSGGLTISGGGLKLPNSGAPESTSLDHYEYLDIAVPLFGSFGVEIEAHFTRIGRQVTMVLDGAKSPSKGVINSVFAQDGVIPLQFRTKRQMSFSIAGWINNVPSFICMSVSPEGGLRIYGGAFGISFPLSPGTEQNGWDTTAVQWLTA